MKVVRPGLLTTVQDTGRYGHQRDGVTVGGAMDVMALRVANLLVGNPEGAAALELTLMGPTLEFTHGRLIAICGGRMSPVIAGKPVPEGRPVLVRAGAILSFGQNTLGAHACIAIAGGIDVPVVLGSRGTHLRARFGGLNGRTLAAGDTIPVGPASEASVRIAGVLAASPEVFVPTEWSVSAAALPRYTANPTIRVTRGTHFGRFDESSRNAFCSRPFRVTPQSDRMGYRLDGPRLALEAPLEPISEPVCAGTVQVPPEGQPIVLMADRQTTGGYPRIAQVITVDLPLIAQTKAGETLTFSEVSLDEAQRLYAEREKTIAEVREGLKHAAH